MASINIKAKTSFSKLFSIAVRIMGNLRMPIYYIAANMGYRKIAIAENRIMRRSESLQLPDSSIPADRQ